MIRWASLLGCVALMGCTFSPDQCFEDSDCPDEQTCVLRADVLLCVSPFLMATNNDTPDSGVTIPDMPMMPDGEDPTPICDESCSADGFEPNDDQETAASLVEEPYGCEREILTERVILAEASLCVEDADWYRLDVLPCEDRSYILNVDIQPTTACGLDTWDVRGDVWSCDSPTVSCTSNERGRRVRFLISNSLGEDFELFLSVRSLGGEFDYVMRVSAEN